MFCLGTVNLVFAQNKPATSEVSYRNNSTKIEELKKKLLANEKDMQTRLDLAELLIKENNFSDTVTYLKAYSDKMPRQGLLILAKAYRGEKEYLSEIRTLTYMISQTESDYVGEALLAQAYSTSGNSPDAVKHFRESIKINPRFKPAYIGLLDEFKSKKSKYLTRQLLEQMTDAFPTEAPFFTELCDAYTQESFIEKAITTCTSAIDMAPSVPDNHVNLSIAYKMDKNVEQAQKIIYQAAKRFPKSAMAQCAAGETAYGVKNIVGAVNYYKLGAALAPKQEKCQSGLADAAFEAEDYTTALNAYVAACQIDRKFTAGLKKAAALLRQKKLDDWHEKFSDAVGKCIDN